MIQHSGCNAALSAAGMWAFEAEKLGGTIYAMDIWQHAPLGRKRFEFAKQVLQSKAVCDEINVYSLSGYRDQHHWPAFDIIQCLGMLYHLQNPMLALNQMVACLNPNGVMLLETAVYPTENPAPSCRFNSDFGVYHDVTTFWGPNWACLVAMLDLCGLTVDTKNVSVLYERVHRVTLLARRNSRPLPQNFGLE